MKRSRSTQELSFIPIQPNVLDNLLARSAALASNAAEAFSNMFGALLAPARQSPDLRSSTEALIDQITSVKQIAVSLNAEMFSEKGLTRKLKLNVFRVIQEHLSNIVKYAYATEVKISLCRTSEKIYLVILDNGRGLRVAHKKNGLCITDIIECAAMNGGKADIKFEPGLGSKLTAEFLIDLPAD